MNEVRDVKWWEDSNKKADNWIQSSVFKDFKCIVKYYFLQKRS